MNTATEKPRQKKAAAKKTAVAAPAPQTRSEYIDVLLRPVARQIMVMTTVMADWPFGDEYPGRSAMLEADGVLMNLSWTPEEWADQGVPRPMTGSMLVQLSKLLPQAIAEVEAAQDFEPAKRRLLLLLMREAKQQQDAMEQAYREACVLNLDGALLSLASGAGGQPLTVVIEPRITADTEITEASAAANRVVSWCSFDIEYLANEVTLLGDECSTIGETRLGSLLRCYGTRIAELNGVLMSYLTNDSITLGDAHRAIYRGAKEFDPKEVA